MPGPGDLTQRLLWLGATQPLCAGAEESGTSAEMGGTAPELSCPGQSLPPAPAGIQLFPQACPPAVTACRDRLRETPSLQSHHQLPAQLPPVPNLLQRKFSFGQPNQAWVSDITYIPTGEGWLYLSIVKNLCTRKMVGYAFSERIDTSLTLEALHLAVRRCKPPKGLIFHSDRGVQYASGAFRECLKSYGIRQSMSRKGDPYDNAVAENFSAVSCAS